MSVSVKKTGIVQASGEIGANICPDTSCDVRNYTYPSGNTYKDWFARTTSVIPSATNYVLSFWAKSTVNGDGVRAHYYSPNTTTTCTNSQGVTRTAGDGNIDITLSTEWEFYWIRYTQTETTAVKHLIFPRVFGSEYGSYGNGAKGSGTISIKCVKFEEGTIPTAWIPCSADADFVANNSGFNEYLGNAQITKGQVNAVDFIEI